MGIGKDARSRRVVWHYSFTRYRHDIQAINAMIDRAEAVAAGKRPLHNATGSSRSLTPSRSWTGTWSNALNSWPAGRVMPTPRLCRGPSGRCW